MHPFNIEKKGYFSAFTALFCTIFFFLYACGDGVSPHVSDNLTPETEQQLQIVAVTPGGDSVSGFDLSISGPVSLQQSGIMSEPFLLNNLKPGNYTVTASMPGYLSSEAEVHVELPEGDISHYDRVTLIMQERSSVSMVNWSSGGEVSSAPAAAGNWNAAPLTLSLPPGALPESAADASGLVQITADRILPRDIDEQYEGTVQSYIHFDPEITDLNTPVTIDIPVKDLSDLIPGLTYTLEPGNIPLEPVGEELAAEKQSGMEMQGRGMQMSANVPGLQRRAVVAKMNVRKSVSWTDFEEVASGACGEGLSVFHEVESGDAGEMALALSNLAAMLSGQTYTLEKDFNGIPDRELSIEVRNRVKTFTVRELPSQSILETSEVNVKPIQFRLHLNECHNSGGG